MKDCLSFRPELKTAYPRTILTPGRALGSITPLVLYCPLQRLSVRHVDHLRSTFSKASTSQPSRQLRCLWFGQSEMRTSETNVQ